MLRKILFCLPSVLVLTVLGILAFGGTAFAATTVIGDDTSFLDLARPVYEAFANHQYSLMAMLLVVLVTALVKRYLGDKIAFLHSDAGGAITALVMSFATAMAAGLVTPGATITFSLLKTAVLVGVGAAGAYALLKNLLVDPFLKPLANKVPAWLKPLFDLALFAFDHGDSDAAVTKATADGAAAVAAAPAEGVAGVVGTPTELK